MLKFVNNKNVNRELFGSFGAFRCDSISLSMLIVVVVIILISLFKDCIEGQIVWEEPRVLRVQGVAIHCPNVGRGTLGSVNLAVRPNSFIYILNGDNTKGSALVHYLGNLRAPSSKRVV